MGRALIVIHGKVEREKAAHWAMAAPAGTRIEFKAAKRSLPQNDRLWACLTEIAQKVEWYGQRLSAEDWKDMFTAALRRARVVPGLDSGSFVPLGMRTSDMSKQEFSDLLELINAFAAERGIEFDEPSAPSPSADASPAPMTHSQTGDGIDTPSPEAVDPTLSAAGDGGEAGEDTQSEAADGQSAAPSPESSPEGHRDLLLRIYSAMQDCVGPSVEDFNRAFKIFDADLARAPDAVKRKAETIRVSLEFACGDKPKRTKAQARSYLAGVIGVGEEELS